MIIEKRLSGEYGRDYIERCSAEDLKYQINTMGSLARDNAYGEILSVEDDGREIPVICGHGGSMWLCRQCKIAILKDELIKKLERQFQG